MDEPRDPQLLKGVLPMLVLALLSERESYGYELVTRLHDGGLDDLAAGTLYPVLNRLERDGQISSRLVASTAGPARKYYLPTDDRHGPAAGPRPGRWRQLAADRRPRCSPAPPRRSPHEHVAARHARPRAPTCLRFSWAMQDYPKYARHQARAAHRARRRRPPRSACGRRSPTSGTPACSPTATSPSSAAACRAGPRAPCWGALAVGVALVALWPGLRPRARSTRSTQIGGGTSSATFLGATTTYTSSTTRSISVGIDPHAGRSLVLYRRRLHGAVPARRPRLAAVVGGARRPRRRTA